MSWEKIDLDLVYRSAVVLPSHWYQRANTLALVRVARGARELMSWYGQDLKDFPPAVQELAAALSPFTDSAQESSDSAEVRRDE